jgi:eukaryotic-like serine/threonine-protein kinase
VERVGYPLAGPFALKLATWPQDPRFEREVELLWRLRHPHVPRLQDRGWWTHPSGVSFPYVVMDWVEGLPLYEWAARYPTAQRQKVEVLAQLAQALAAVHAVGGIHRDIKGGNVLVRMADMRALLTDFGSSTYLGAPRLTWEDLPPGTPGYRSPEAVLHRLRWRQSSGEPYQATPADDVYALGVTAWRLMTGNYPPPYEPVEAPEGSVDLRLPPPPPSAWLTELRKPVEEPAAVAQEAREGNQEEGRTAGLMDAVHEGSAGSAPPAEHRWLSLEVPKTPLQGQARPPCKKGEVVIHGGCWGRPQVSTPPCRERDFEWRGGCYSPIIVPAPPATTEPR